MQSDSDCFSVIKIFKEVLVETKTHFNHIQYSLHFGIHTLSFSANNCWRALFFNELKTPQAYEFLQDIDCHYFDHTFFLVQDEGVTEK